MPSSASPPISITLFTIYNYTICSQLTETELLYNCSITNWLGNLGNQRNLFDLLWTLKPVLLSKDINWWYCFFERHQVVILFSTWILYIYDKQVGWGTTWAEGMWTTPISTLIINSVCPSPRRRGLSLLRSPRYKINVNKLLSNAMPIEMPMVKDCMVP